VVTTEFLAHQHRISNDLSPPVPPYQFPGWCPATAGASLRRTGRGPTTMAPPRPWCWPQPRIGLGDRPLRRAQTARRRRPS